MSTANSASDYFTLGWNLSLFMTDEPSGEMAEDKSHELWKESCKIEHKKRQEVTFDDVAGLKEEKEELEGDR